MITHKFGLKVLNRFFNLWVVGNFVETGDHVILELVKVPKAHEESDAVDKRAIHATYV